MYTHKNINTCKYRWTNENRNNSGLAVGRYAVVSWQLEMEIASGCLCVVTHMEKILSIWMCLHLCEAQTEISCLASLLLFPLHISLFNDMATF